MKKQLKKKAIAIILSLGLVTGMVQGIGNMKVFKISAQAATKKKYDEQKEFYGGLAAVRWKNYWGYINKKGKIVIPLKYTYAESFYNGKTAKVELNGKVGVINKKGKVIVPIKYDKIEDYFEGTAVVVLNGKYGIINKKGKLFIPAEYEFLFPFNNGFTEVQKTAVNGG